MHSTGSEDSFKAVLNRLLQASGRPLKEIAARAGITDGYLSLMRTGRREAPPLQVVRAIAQALGVGAGDQQKLLAAAEAARKGRRENRIAPTERYRATQAPGMSESSMSASEYLTWSGGPGTLTIEVYPRERLVRIGLRAARLAGEAEHEIELEVALYGGKASKPYGRFSMRPGSRYDTPLQAGVNRLECQWVNGSEGREPGRVTLVCKVD
jgi:transcriptional regulator with XRE-family HTH domain